MISIILCGLVSHISYVKPWICDFQDAGITGPHGFTSRCNEKYIKRAGVAACFFVLRHQHFLRRIIGTMKLTQLKCMLKILVTTKVLLDQALSSLRLHQSQARLWTRNLVIL